MTQESARSLWRQGMRRVVITLGERGSLAAGQDRMELIPAFKVHTETPRRGRCFHGSFRGISERRFAGEEALPSASLYAALSTTKVGHSKSFCKRAEFERSGGIAGAACKRALSKC